MKTRYKILITFGIIVVTGNFLYVFSWTWDMLVGYRIGVVSGIVIAILTWWICKDYLDYS